MRVRVLGKSPSWTDAGGACSGYLVEHDGRRLLLDCGNGVFGKLRAVCDYVDVDAVVISHLHADHCLDLVPFSYALIYGPHPDRPPPALHAPPGAGDVLRRITGAWGGEDLVERAFALTEYDADAALEVGGMRIDFRAVEHFVQAFAVRIAAGDARFVFGADTGPTDALVEHARGADLLLAEATLVTPDGGHLTAAQAGEHAARAGVGRLVLTHISDELDHDAALRAARAAYDGPVEIAREGAVYEL